MVFDGIVTSPRGTLSPSQALELARVYLENANQVKDAKISLVLCHDTEVSLSQAKRAAKHTDDPTLKERVALAYIGLGNLLHDCGHHVEAQASYKKARKLGSVSPSVTDTPVANLSVLRSSAPPTPTNEHNSASTVSVSPEYILTTNTQHEPDTKTLLLEADTTDDSSQTPHPTKQNDRSLDIATIHRHIFPRNVRPPAIGFRPPEPDTRLADTPQLACCLGLLGLTHEVDDILEPATRTWLQLIKNEPEEQDRFKTLATDVVRAFKRDEIKDAKAVIEVVYLAPVLEKDDFRYLLKEFHSGIEQSTLLDIHQLEGLAQLIQGADKTYLDADDLVKVLQLLSTRLRGTHQQSTKRLYQLTLAVSHVLDAMADAGVEGLDRETLHAPLRSYLDGLKESTDAYLVYQAAYAYQALLYVPDNESRWQATVRRTGKVIQGVSGMMGAVKSIDFNGFMEGLKNIQQGLEGTTKVVGVLKSAYDDAKSLTTSGKGLLECLKEGLSFDRKSAWYPALRGADALIVNGYLSEFKKLVCEAPCRRDPAFQWGVCQRLGEVASNTAWDSETRRGAIAFLGEMYVNDEEWGQHTSVKQWILGILMQISSRSGDEMQFAGTLLQDLRNNGDSRKQGLYRVCSDNGPGSHQLGIVSTAIGSPSLLDRVQGKPDVEGALRQLRRQRLKDREKVVYIPPQAKVGLQAHDEDRFSLMENVDKFLSSNQKVFLVLGDSGSGKSTFNRELECHLWRSYKKNGPIPLYINLPAIDKPEHDMISKQLRKTEFTEPQIRELKFHRNFILICDGYDESQQTHNLYTCNRLNEAGEWQARMVISCRSEYLGADYRDRFQPGDRNNRSDVSLFQEAVLTPFSQDQVQDYIDQYVSVYRPLWEAGEYKRALEGIPSLKELVKNPFLMSLSLEVLPRMMDQGQDLSTTHITRVELYDQFIEHWLERGKKRLGEKNLSSQAMVAFENLTGEGFTQNGIHFLKQLCAAIYKNQGGQPIVGYSRYKDEKSWKTEFFGKEDEKQLLREACPLTRNGNQYRFIHRSLLEYGVTLAIFDPQELRERKVPLDHRMSTLSIVRHDEQDSVEDSHPMIEQGPDLNSPLVWRSFVNEPSILQFLEERVQQEPWFKQLLLDYIEQSKRDKKWYIAASNAITVLVRAGVQFNNADLSGIRIPYADLSFGMFDSAQFQGSDLRHVDFRGAWLRQANLSDVQMTSVQFGELPLLQHDSGVEMCVYSPDGKTIAAGLSNGKIIVYSTFNWERLWILKGHSEASESVAYSPDSTRVVSGSRDRTIRLWDISTGVCIHVLKGHDDIVWSVAYSPRGDQVVSASSDKRIKLWDVETGGCHHILIGHTGIVSEVIYSPQGNQIASRGGDFDYTVRLWDIEKRTCLHVLREHEWQVGSIAYSPQGDQIASGCHNTVRLWNVAAGDCLHILTGIGGSVNSVVYSPNGGQVACCGDNNSVQLWDVKTGVCVHTLVGSNYPVSRVVYSPQGDLIASYAYYADDKAVRLWDTETGICRQTLTGHSEEVTSVVFSPKGDRIVSSSRDTTIRLWDVGTGTSRYISNAHKGSVNQIKLSPKGDRVATCSNDCEVRVWDVETGTCCHILEGHWEPVNCVAYSPQGHQIASGSGDGTLRLWNTDTGGCIHVLKNRVSGVFNTIYSPDGGQVAAGCFYDVRLWDAESGECRHVLSCNEIHVRGVVYSQDGGQVVAHGENPTAQVWDPETGVLNHNLTGHSDQVNSVAYSPQDDRIVSASKDSTLRVWDVATGECRHILIGHNVVVSSVTYSPRGDQIASGGEDGSLKVWDMEAGTCRWTSSGHRKRISRIVYSPRGDTIASASNEKSVQLWDATSGQCRAVIQGFKAGVNAIEWIVASSVDYIATGCSEGVVAMWKVEGIEDHCDVHVSLHWGTVNGELNVEDTAIQNVQGLSQLNRQLLLQRGAVGEPVHRLREASKELATMASVVSQLKTPSNRPDEGLVLPGGPSVEQFEQWLEQGKGLLCQDFVAFIMEIIRRHK
ncbi:MAG: hypothetical protein J3Q66DRAFT_434963 [Benniella sp.]|nr:MAG: hypothetical protein J3Q66DRAFT_434963 [Benniella sp.]